MELRRWHLICRPDCTSRYLLCGPKLSKEIVESFEHHYLYELRSIQDRLRNEIHSFKTENVEEEVVKEMMTMIKNTRTKMMKFVTEEKGNIVPRACKDAFWNMCNVLNLFYATNELETRFLVL
ncbi:putative ent-kaurene synthase [Helianthus annuus]|uniref:Ent-kaurene synthase n=1 Tax=Helianthus annuus TaxID=4232 RepID=A0A9K3NU71_HELAN|nr:putative ent-kaurene synthase [Helianthus annuus]KAJ0606600.1 putative ent-kaurene synthase [Helianthus annuus]KAJ0933934.1 putative ent-kaurene synthase [Helianthus annuus]KAJ0942002.1 putative ent-kaurene synthase [Helianthus annuus]